MSGAIFAYMDSYEYVIIQTNFSILLKYLVNQLLIDKK